MRILLPVALAMAVVALHAQSPKPTPTQPAVPPTRPLKAQGPALNLRFTVEVYTLGQSDANRLLEASTDDASRHSRVLELAAKGKAHFETLITDVTRNGQRSVVEQVHEVRYPTGFKQAADKGTPNITFGYETRNIGGTLEWEPIFSASSKSCEMNMVLQLIQLAGFRDEGTQDFPKGQPTFATQKLTATQALSPGRMAFLGTLSKAPQIEEPGLKPPQDQEVRLAFGHLDLMEVASANPGGQAVPAAFLEHRLSLYSLNREVAREILAAAETKPGGCYAAVRTLADHGQARLERFASLRTKSGQRAVVEEIKEIRSQTYNSKAGMFETRNSGLTLEIEPLLEPGNIVDINLVPQLVLFLGDMQGTGPSGVIAKYPGTPLYETRKVTTSLTANVGEQALIGTFNPPGDDGLSGQKDAGRVWLGFILTTVVKP